MRSSKEGNSSEIGSLLRFGGVEFCVTGGGAAFRMFCSRMGLVTRRACGFTFSVIRSAWVMPAGTG